MKCRTSLGMCWTATDWSHPRGRARKTPSSSIRWTSHFAAEEVMVLRGLSVDAAIARILRGGTLCRARFRFLAQYAAALYFQGRSSERTSAVVDLPQQLIACARV